MSEINKEELEARFEHVRLRTSKALDERVKATLAGADTGVEEPSKKGRTAMFRLIKTVGGKLSLAAAGVAIAVGLACYLIGSRSVAFADVLEKVRAAHTVKFKITTQTAGLLPAQTASSLPVSLTEDVMMMEPGKSRITMPGDAVMIADESRQEFLVLDPVKRTAMVITPSEKRPSQGPLEFLDQMRKLEAGSQEKLGQREIDGKTATGFHVSKGPIDWTIWVNDQTSLPIRVELKTSMFGAPVVEVMSDFVFDEPMDESLFSLTPPAGYTIEKQQVNASLPQEEDLINGLRFATWATCGLFPAEFNQPSILKTMLAQKEKGIKPDMGGRTREEAAKYMATEFAMKMMRATLFVGMILKPENDWHYAGNGVKAGDASKAVCWWRPGGSNTYRVVFGDFSVRDCSPSDLPTAPAK
jgi:outer membrane lipoprotein-sorting protein